MSIKKYFLINMSRQYLTKYIVRYFNKFWKKYKKIIRQIIKPKRINFAYLKSINPEQVVLSFFFWGGAYLH